MTKERVWEELRKTTSYLYGIEEYTHNKRQWNRRSKLLILFVSVSCVLSSLFQFFDLLSWVKWSTLITSILTAIITAIKEFLPILSQPEEELRELDDICNFYRNHLKDLEKFFASECNNSSEFTDKKREEFESILINVGDRETKMKRLCRRKCWESKDVKQKTKNHLRITFHDAQNYIPYCSFD